MARYTSAKWRPSHTFDALLEMKDAGLVAADAAGTVDGQAKVLDAGSGRFEAKLIVDISDIEVATGDEGYRVIVQGSNASDFSSGVVNLASRIFGDSTVTGDSAGTAAGRYEMGVSNAGADGAFYRYLRVYTDVQGTIATGINYRAWFVKQ